jgi:hypothetical protein
MHMVFLLLLISSAPRIVSSEDESDHPPILVHDYEWDMAQIVSPPPYWGRRMREEQTLHVMTLGGSNSDGEGNGFRWPEYLREQMKEVFPTIPTSCLNKGEHLLYM